MSAVMGVASLGIRQGCAINRKTVFVFGLQRL